MRWLWILFIPFLMGMAQIHSVHDNERKINDDFDNIYDNAQDQSFTQVLTSTPNWSDLKDGQIVIYISTTTTSSSDVRLMLRAGTTIYASPTFPIIRGR